LRYGINKQFVAGLLDYAKVFFNGREYAQIGTRLYTEHAVQAFMPSGRKLRYNTPQV
jgi:hypothetical protein